MLYGLSGPLPLTEALGFINRSETTGARPQEVQWELLDPAGEPLVVNNEMKIYRHNGSGWEEVSGLARDIDIGTNGPTLCDRKRMAMNGRSPRTKIDWASSSSKKFN